MVLNRWDKLLRLLLISLELAGSSQLRAAHCDTGNSELTCNVELIAGVSVAHYRVKGATSTSRAWTWLQSQFPSIFGKAPPFYRSVALLVGVTEYKHLHRLPNVRNDLARMRDYLLSQEEFDDVYILQDQDVTSGAVNNLMFGYFGRSENLGTEDRFLFYYSGHGSNETGVGQMQFGQAEPKHYNADANLPVSTWKDWGTAIQAKQALFLFDACALGAQIEKGGRSERDGQLLRDLGREKARIAFAATRGGEAAQGDEDSSYFTFEFLRAVQSAKADVNNVGFMTIMAISEAMQPKLAELAEQHGYKWFYTTPKGLDAKNYPGTFVFLNPKVPKDVESRFAELINKGPETPSQALRTITPAPEPSSSTPVPNTSKMTTPTYDFFGILDGGSGASMMRRFVPEGTRPAVEEELRGQPASAEVRVAIRKRYDRLSEAVAKNDFQAYKAVFSLDFVGRDGGKVSNAETYFSRVQSAFAMGLQTLTYDIQDVTITAPDTAVVTVKADTKAASVRGIETDRDTWKHIGDQWICTETNVLEMHFLD
jgi:Caspase domain/Domain of unknown function (DUF4440)